MCVGFKEWSVMIALTGCEPVQPPVEFVLSLWNCSRLSVWNPRALSPCGRLGARWADAHAARGRLGGAHSLQNTSLLVATIRFFNIFKFFYLDIRRSFKLDTQKCEFTFARKTACTRRQGTTFGPGSMNVWVSRSHASDRAETRETADARERVDL